jgi:glucokinase
MFLLFDIGGSKMRLVVTDNSQSFGEPRIVATPHDFEKAIKVFRKIFNEISKGSQIKAVAGGVRRFDSSRETLRTDFGLPGWSGKPLKDKLAEIVNAPIYLENDAALVGLGEAVRGAGRGYSVVVYMTISTGVGGVRIVDKKIDKNKFGFEPGHQIIDFDWSVFPGYKVSKEDHLGQFEAYVSGTSIEKRLGKKAHEVTDEKVWDEISKLVAVGLNNTIVHWSPDVVVLGGGMMKSPGISIDKVKQYLKEILTIFPEQPEIKKAELGELGGLHGALHYIKQQYLD